MLQKQRNILLQTQKLLDMMLCALGLWCAHSLRAITGFAILGGSPEIEGLNRFIWLLIVVPILTPIVLQSLGYYRSVLAPGFRRTRYISLMQGCLLLFAFIVSAIFLFKVSLPRSVILLFIPFTFILIVLKDELLRLLGRSTLGKNQILHRVLVVADKEDEDKIRSQITAQGLEFTIVGHLDLAKNKTGDLQTLLHEQSPNIVFVSGRHSYFSEIEEIIRYCELEGVDVWVTADFFKSQPCKPSIETMGGSPILAFRTAPDFSFQSLAKVIFDYISSFFALLCLSPLFLIIAMAIKITSPGPVFFKQNRSGLNGKPFVMYKFRSMINNAEMKKHELERLNEMSGPVFKVTNDPRVTKVGAFLRKTSLDELPQLLNVFRGEMSIVGPRPLPIDETLKFEDIAYRRRLSMKPGLTCLWQISGRNNVTDFEEWVRLDLEYIDNWSFWSDMKIVFKTIPVVLKGVGAK